MNPHHLALAAALVAAQAGFCPRTALAVERACPGLRLAPDADFRARFPDLLERIEHEFAARSDLDACALVELRLEGDTVVTMSVTLPDGRAASRSVTRSEDVVPTLQALLLLPDRPASTPATPPAMPARTAPRRPLRAAKPSPPERDAPTPSTQARSLGVELSVITGARIGDGQVGYGVGALSFLEVHGWLLGFEGRADGYRALVGGDPETALELAILTGKRFDFDNVALDLTAGPAMAIKGLAFSRRETVQANADGTAPPPPPPPPRSDPSTGPVPRLLLGARLGFFPRSAFRTFVGIDGELGPARGDDDAGPSSARLPAYSLGLSLGGTVGTP